MRQKKRGTVYVRDHFSVLAPFYEFFIKPKPPETLASLIDMPRSGALLDIGGGTGRVSQYLTNGSALVVVGDPSRAMLRHTRHKSGLEAVSCLSENSPFLSCTFDRIIMVDAFHHVCDQKRTAQELWRVLKPGGRVVIEEPNHECWVVKLVAWLEKLALMRSHFLKPREVEKLFIAGGAITSIYKHGHTAWIVAQKQS